MTTAPKPFVFTLMPFEEKFNDIYKLGIKEAANDAGGYCERVDEQIFEERMLDQIYNQINKADVIVADLTGRNPNVFYEVGYAHALGKRVILLTQNADDIPFDLKHHYHIVYGGSIVKLKEELSKRLEYYFEHTEKKLISGFEQLEFYLEGYKIENGKTLKKKIGEYSDYSFNIAIHNLSNKSHDGDFNLGILFPVKQNILLASNHRDQYKSFDGKENKLIIFDIYIDKLFPDFWTDCIFPLDKNDWVKDNSRNIPIPFSLIYYSDFETKKIDFTLIYDYTK